MTAQHTEGPWAASDKSNLISASAGVLAYTVNLPNNDLAEQQANARLIAASPDLLTALEGLTKVSVEVAQLRDIHDGTDTAWMEVITAHDKARAAIAKARNQ